MPQKENSEDQNIQDQNMNFIPPSGTGFTPSSAGFAKQPVDQDHAYGQDYQALNFQDYQNSPQFYQGLQYDPNYQYSYDAQYPVDAGGNYSDPNNPGNFDQNFQDYQNSPQFYQGLQYDPNYQYSYDVQYPNQNFNNNYVDQQNFDQNYSQPQNDQAAQQPNPEELPPQPEVSKKSKKHKKETEVLSIQEKEPQQIPQQDLQFYDASTPNLLKNQASFAPKIFPILVGLSLILAIVLAVEISTGKINQIIAGPTPTAFEKCQDEGGQTNSIYPFSCIDKSGNIFFKDSNLAEEKTELEKQTDKNSVTLKPKRYEEFSKTIVGKNTAKMQPGLVIYSDKPNGFSHEYSMIINNKNLPDNEMNKADLIQKADNFLTTGQSLAENAALINLFKFDITRNFDMIDLGRVTSFSYSSVDSFVIFYTLDGDDKKLDLSHNSIAVRVLAKKGDHYILLEKYLEDSIVSRLNTEHKTSCFKEGYNSPNYPAEKDCYLGKIRSNISIQTRVEQVAFELLETFSLE